MWETPPSFYEKKMPIRLLDRICICGHRYGDHWIDFDPSCRKCADCKNFTYSEILDSGITYLAERLQDVLRRRHQDTCSNCGRVFSLADVSYNPVSRWRTSFRIVCQDCGEGSIEITKERAVLDDEVSDFIRHIDVDDPIK